MRRLLLLASLTAVLGTGFALPAHAQLPGGPSGLKDKDRIGITLTQLNGFKGVIYLKRVPNINPQGIYIGEKLEFHQSNMNTKMKWRAKMVVPQGKALKSFSVHTGSEVVNINPAAADSWDGRTLIDDVMVTPWKLAHVMNQCNQQLKRADGTFKDSATFLLQGGEVRGNAVCAAPGAPPSNGQSFSALSRPRIRVTAYVLVSTSSRQADGSRPPRNPRPSTGRDVPTRRPQTGAPVRPTLPTPTIRPTRRPSTQVRPTSRESQIGGKRPAPPVKRRPTRAGQRK